MLTERGPRDRLWHVASRQHGYFTAAQALQAGDQLINRAFATSLLVPHLL